MDDVLLNPVEIGNKLLEASNSAGKSVVPVSEAYDAYKTAELDFKSNMQLNSGRLRVLLKIVNSLRLKRHMSWLKFLKMRK